MGQVLRNRGAASLFVMQFMLQRLLLRVVVVLAFVAVLGELCAKCSVKFCDCLAVQPPLPAHTGPFAEAGTAQKSK